MQESVLVTAAATPVSYLWLIPVLPAVGVLFNLFFGNRAGKRVVGVVAPAVVLGSLAVSCVAFAEILRLPRGAVLVQHVYRWIGAGVLQIDVAFRLDSLSGVMALIVTGVGFLIHVYSVGYMHDDPRFSRYFAYLNLFTVAMLTLVLADNLPLLFVGWEGVGLCSYLLIGFWFTDQANAAAGKKAFVVNRVGDAGFLLAMFLLFWNLGDGARGLRFEEIAAHAGEISAPAVTAIALLLLVGATGKSAQLPLYVWLPDAMAGPTPVSALIHAATMVTAGVYLIARLSFLYVLSPVAMEWVATVGALTAIFAASIGLVQNDIKRVLAYSTISQLGYMFVGVGVGAFAAGVFHLMTHAFFKGLLFLGSGSVIHALGGEQDMRRMGGLRQRLPVTFWTFLAGTMAIAGLPPLAGFFSKDAILVAAVASGHTWLWLVGVITAGMTSFYMFRLLFMTFFGESRVAEHVRSHVHESPPSMTVPLLVLAVLSVIGGWVSLPLHLAWGDAFGEFLGPAVAGRALPHLSAPVELALMVVSVGVAGVGLWLAYWLYVARPELPERVAQRAAAFHRLLLHKYYVDEIYDAVFVRPTTRFAEMLWKRIDVALIDGAVDGAATVVDANARVWRRLQTGNVQHYAISMLVGAALLLGYYALG